jgi:hypothetical protein
MDFALERARTLTPDSDSEEYLPHHFIGECVSTAMDIGFLTAPKRGTFGGKITPKALRKLKQVGKQKW